MGKNKEQQTELMHAFSRMNYLYQASVVTSKSVPDSALAGYYGRLMKEVSKKVVEKIHPDIKRALCISCSYPLFANDIHADVKIKTHKKSKKRRKKDLCIISNSGKQRKIYHTNQSISAEKEFEMLHKIKKNIKPNKLVWNCNKCGFSKTFLQCPGHYLWIEKCETLREIKRMRGSGVEIEYEIPKPSFPCFGIKGDMEN